MILAFDDYSVLTLDIPPLSKLRTSEGYLQLADGSRGGGYKNQLFLINSIERLRFECRVSSTSRNICISELDDRFYEKIRMTGRSVKFKPIGFNHNQKFKVWWYEANYFGFFKLNRLLQLDSSAERIISYADQKEKYLREKQQHKYIPSLMIILSASIYLITYLYVKKSKGVKS